MSRRDVEMILVGLMMADNELKDWSKMEAKFMDSDARRCALSVCNGSVPDVLYDFRPKEDERLRDSMCRLLESTAVRGKFRRSIEKLLTGEELGLSVGELERIESHIEELKGAKT